MIHKGLKFLIKTVSIKNWLISNNILLSVKFKDPANPDPTVAMELVPSYDPSTDKLLVFGNTV